MASPSPSPDESTIIKKDRLSLLPPELLSAIFLRVAKLNGPYQMVGAISRKLMPYTRANLFHSVWISHLDQLTQLIRTLDTTPHLSTLTLVLHLHLPDSLLTYPSPTFSSLPDNLFKIFRLLSNVTRLYIEDSPHVTQLVLNPPAEGNVLKGLKRLILREYRMNLLIPIPEQFGGLERYGELKELELVDYDVVTAYHRRWGDPNPVPTIPLQLQGGHPLRHLQRPPHHQQAFQQNPNLPFHLQIQQPPHLQQQQQQPPFLPAPILLPSPQPPPNLPPPPTKNTTILSLHITGRLTLSTSTLISFFSSLSNLSLKSQGESSDTTGLLLTLEPNLVLEKLSISIDHLERRKLNFRKVDSALRPFLRKGLKWLSLDQGTFGMRLINYLCGSGVGSGSGSSSSGSGRRSGTAGGGGGGGEGPAPFLTHLAFLYAQDVSPIDLLRLLSPPTPSSPTLSNTRRPPPPLPLPSLQTLQLHIDDFSCTGPTISDRGGAFMTSEGTWGLWPGWVAPNWGSWGGSSSSSAAAAAGGWFDDGVNGVTGADDDEDDQTGANNQLLPPAGVRVGAVGGPQAWQAAPPQVQGGAQWAAVGGGHFIGGGGVGGIGGIGGAGVNRLTLRAILAARAQGQLPPPQVLANLPPALAAAVVQQQPPIPPLPPVQNPNGDSESESESESDDPEEISRAKEREKESFTLDGMKRVVEVAEKRGVRVTGTVLRALEVERQYQREMENLWEWTMLRNLGTGGGGGGNRA